MMGHRSGLGGGRGPGEPRLGCRGGSSWRAADRLRAPRRGRRRGRRGRRRWKLAPRRSSLASRGVLQRAPGRLNTSRQRTCAHSTGEDGCLFVGQRVDLGHPDRVLATSRHMVRSCFGVQGKDSAHALAEVLQPLAITKCDCKCLLGPHPNPNPPLIPFFRFSAAPNMSGNV
jgi:hypothetical protein